MMNVKYKTMASIFLVLNSGFLIFCMVLFGMNLNIPYYGSFYIWTIVSSSIQLAFVPLNFWYLFKPIDWDAYTFAKIKKYILFGGLYMTLDVIIIFLVVGPLLIISRLNVNIELGGLLQFITKWGILIYWVLFSCLTWYLKTYLPRGWRIIYLIHLQRQQIRLVNPKIFKSIKYIDKVFNEPTVRYLLSLSPNFNYFDKEKYRDSAW